MAKLTSPRVSVTFTELGISAITRGEKGTVALIVRDEAAQAPPKVRRKPARRAARQRGRRGRGR